MADATARPLYAEVEGHGPEVVLLHGQPGTARDWQPVARRLTDTFTVITADRPGYGRTGGRPTGFGGNAEAAVALLDRLDRSRALIVGHSWAGGAALAMAERWPTRVAGLVLVSSVGPGERMAWYDRLLAAPGVGELIAVVTIGGVGRVVASRSVQALAGRGLAKHAPAREAIAAITSLSRGASPAWRSFVSEQRSMLAELEGLRPGLAGIAAPTAILHGSADRQVPAEVGEALQQAIPGASRRLVDGAGHLLPRERPDAVAAAVREVAARAGLAGP